MKTITSHKLTDLQVEKLAHYISGPFFKPLTKSMGLPDVRDTCCIHPLKLLTATCKRTKRR